MICSLFLLTACALEEEKLQSFTNAEVTDKFIETGWRGSQEHFIKVTVSESIINFRVTEALYQAMTTGSRIDGEYNADFELRMITITQGES